MAERKRIGVELKPDDTHSGFLTGIKSQDQEKVDILLDAIAEMHSTIVPRERLASVVDHALEVTRAERGMLLLQDRWGELQVHVARDADRKDLEAKVDFSRTIPREVIGHGVGVTFVVPEDETLSAFPQSIVNLGLRTVMCVPLKVKDRIIGVLYVDSKSTVRQFEEGDLSLFLALSYQLAIAVENALLREKEQALSLAHDIQKRLLPSGGPEVPGFQVHGVSRSCDETGGDYFDYLDLDPGHLGIAVGDVTGHGFPAALLMATGRAILRALLSEKPDLASAIRRMNRSMKPDLGDDRFFSVFCASLDIMERTVRYVRAGHEPPLLFRADSGTFEVLDAPGMALGFLEDYDYREAGPVELRAGDVLVLYTDGIPEARMGDRERVDRFFGMDRFRKVIEESASGTAEEIVDTIVSRVKRFVGTESFEDDVTLVVVKAV